MSVSPYSSGALKRSAAHFLTGKAASGLLTLTIMLWLVRLLPVEEYGAYVVLISGMELAQTISTVGIPWIAVRFMPEFRLCSSGKQLAHFSWRILALICLCLAIGSLLLFVALPWLLEPLNLVHHTDTARLYLLVLLVEGLGQNARENILGPLLQQGVAQISLVARNLTLLLLLAGVAIAQNIVHPEHILAGDFSASVLKLAAGNATVHLQQLAIVELAASALSTIVALYGLFRYLLEYRDLPGKEGWKPPNWSKMWRTARHMYFSNFVTMTYGM
jgi:O-antigen/teichoic acid export membrane protein